MINLLFKRQAKRIIFFTLSGMVLGSCVQPPAFKTEDYALIISNYPIVAVNSIEIEKAYKLDIKAGENSLVVVYNYYQHDYFCTFNWAAKEGTA